MPCAGIEPATDIALDSNITYRRNNGKRSGVVGAGSISARDRHLYYQYLLVVFILVWANYIIVGLPTAPRNARKLPVTVVLIDKIGIPQWSNR